MFYIFTFYYFCIIYPKQEEGGGGHQRQQIFKGSEGARLETRKKVKEGSEKRN